MSPILSQEEVIYRCKQVHGDKYDYSKVVYKGSHKKLIIIRRIDGEFQQTYNKHFYSKTGCYYCGKEKSSKYRTLSQDVAIAQCKDIHGDKYDYSKSIYKDSAYRKIIIICILEGGIIQAFGHDNFLVEVHFCKTQQQCQIGFWNPNTQLSAIIKFIKRGNTICFRIHYTVIPQKGDQIYKRLHIAL